jgi:hypothetical protein
VRLAGRQESSAVGRRARRRCRIRARARSTGWSWAANTLDLDATDDPLHGHQEGRFFHGYYDARGVLDRSGGGVDIGTPQF